LSLLLLLGVCACVIVVSAAAVAVFAVGDNGGDSVNDDGNVDVDVNVAVDVNVDENGVHGDVVVDADGNGTLNGDDSSLSSDASTSRGEYSGTDSSGGNVLGEDSGGVAVGVNDNAWIVCVCSVKSASKVWFSLLSAGAAAAAVLSKMSASNCISRFCVCSMKSTSKVGFSLLSVGAGAAAPALSKMSASNCIRSVLHMASSLLQGLPIAISMPSLLLLVISRIATSLQLLLLISLQLM